MIFPVHIDASNLQYGVFWRNLVTISVMCCALVDVSFAMVNKNSLVNFQVKFCALFVWFSKKDGHSKVEKINKGDFIEI